MSDSKFSSGDTHETHWKIHLCVTCCVSGCQGDRKHNSLFSLDFAKLHKERGQDGLKSSEVLSFNPVIFFPKYKKVIQVKNKEERD